jgi:hypothetical protein
VTGSDSSKPSHPSLQALPQSPTPSDVRALLDQVQDFRRSLWNLSATRPATRTSEIAYRCRASLGDAEQLLHELRRAIERDAIVRLVHSERPGGDDAGPAEDP